MLKLINGYICGLANKKWEQKYIPIPNALYKNSIFVLYFVFSTQCGKTCFI